MADLLKLNGMTLFSGAEVSLTLPENKIGVVLGGAESGKGELLRRISGLIPFAEGEIFLRGDLIARSGKSPTPRERNIEMVLQEGGFYPHLNLLENLKLGLQKYRINNKSQHCMHVLAELGLDGLARHYPAALNREQLRYLLIARALATRPALLLLEEPLLDLSVEARYTFLDRLPQIVEAFDCGILLSTQVRQGVLFAGDYAGVMEHEILLQWDSPQNLYLIPKKRTVAHYMGEGVLVKGVVHDELRLDTELGMVDHPSGFGLPTGTRLELLIRPEDIVFDEKARRRARIVQRAVHGGKTFYRLQLTPELEIERAFSSYLDERISGELRHRLEIRSMVLFKRKKSS